MGTVQLFSQLLIGEHYTGCFRILSNRILCYIHPIIQLVWSWRRMILRRFRWRWLSSIYSCCSFCPSTGSELLEFVV